MESPKKRSGGPDRIIGVDNETESHLKAALAWEVTNHQEPGVSERNPTPKEQSVIHEVFKNLPAFIKEYGADQARFIFLNQIHILDETKGGEEIKKYLEEGMLGRYLPGSARVEILPDAQNLMGTAHSLVHELMHAHSFMSLTFHGDDKNGVEDLTMRRHGLSINERGGARPFTFLDEAVAEELTKRFCERYFPQTNLAENEPETHGRPDESAPATPFTSLLNERGPLIYSYTDERTFLAVLIEKMYEKNKEN